MSWLVKHVLLVLDNSSSVPRYRQIVDAIRDMVLSGRLGPGDPLPSVRGLAADLLTSVITTRRAYQELEAAGLIVTKPGIGTFVRELAPGERRRAGRAEVEARLRELVATARSMGLADEEILGILKRVLAGGAT